MSITVFIPAFNAEKWLGAAIESVLAQTYRDFTLLVIDDGSTDGTVQVAKSYTDTRVTVIQNPANLGIAATRNKALRKCTTTYLACLDADDIAVPDRLERQLAYLKDHPDTVVLGGQGEYFGEATGPARYPVGEVAVRARMPFDNPFMQNTVVLNVPWLRNKGLQYDPSAHYCEDYDFWAAIFLAGGAMSNLADCLVKYRVHGASVSRSHREQQEANANVIRRRMLGARGVTLSEVQWQFLNRCQFETSTWANRETRLTLRSIGRRIENVTPDSFERIRFLCSALPRPRSLLDKALLALCITRVFGGQGAAFVSRFLGGRG